MFFYTWWEIYCVQGCKAVRVFSEVVATPAVTSRLPERGVPTICMRMLLIFALTSPLGLARQHSYSTFGLHYRLQTQSAHRSSCVSLLLQCNWGRHLSQLIARRWSRLSHFQLIGRHSFLAAISQGVVLVEKNPHLRAYLIGHCPCGRQPPEDSLCPPSPPPFSANPKGDCSLIGVNWPKMFSAGTSN